MTIIQHAVNVTGNRVGPRCLVIRLLFAALFFNLVPRAFFPARQKALGTRLLFLECAPCWNKVYWLAAPPTTSIINLYFSSKVNFTPPQPPHPLPPHNPLIRSDEGPTFEAPAIFYLAACHYPNQPLVDNPVFLLVHYLVSCKASPGHRKAAEQPTRGKHSIDHSLSRGRTSHRTSERIKRACVSVKSLFSVSVRLNGEETLQREFHFRCKFRARSHEALLATPFSLVCCGRAFRFTDVSTGITELARSDLELSWSGSFRDSQGWV